MLVQGEKKEKRCQGLEMYLGPLLMLLVAYLGSVVEGTVGQRVEAVESCGQDIENDELKT